MNILLTNDDGIDSPGIRLLAQALRAQGKSRVFVLAPDSDRSGVSGAISFLREPLRLVEKEIDSWSCSGNPTDCVALAFQGAVPLRPDLVISGINRGANMGTDLFYSGTAAAARQGSFLGVPSLALSLAGTGAAINTPGAVSEYYWDMAVAFVLAHLDEFISQWEADTFLNINIPNSPGGPEGMAAAFPSKREYRDSLIPYKAPNGDIWCFVKPGDVITKSEAGSDSDLVSRNLASVSPILIHPVIGGKGMDAGGRG